MKLNNIGLNLFASTMQNLYRGLPFDQAIGRVFGNKSKGKFGGKKNRRNPKRYPG